MPEESHSAGFSCLGLAGASLGILVLSAVVLYAMGRTPICTCGSVKLWHGAVASAENSQHIADWYTLSHIVHGVLFCAGTALILPRAPVASRFIAALLLESGWEILENTPLIIERYRAATIALDYFGDSILNSLSDIGAMALGFLAARRLPVPASIGLVLALEGFSAFMIRDNLALNVLMLVTPIEAVKQWQDGR